MTGRIAQAWTVGQLPVNARTMIDGLCESSYSLGPDGRVNVIARDARNKGTWVLPAKWGLDTNAEGHDSGARMINADLTKLTDVTYHAMAQGRRCLIPVNGFYLWRLDGHVWYVFDAQGRILLLAGLYNTIPEQRRQQARARTEVTIVTRVAPGRLRLIRDDYTPLIVDPSLAGRWLDHAIPLDKVIDEVAAAADRGLAGLRMREVAPLHGDGESNIHGISADEPVALPRVRSLSMGDADCEDLTVLRINGRPSPWEIDKGTNTREKYRRLGLPDHPAKKWAIRLKAEWRALRDGTGTHMPSWEEFMSVASYPDGLLDHWGVMDRSKGWRTRLLNEIHRHNQSTR